jgi:serine/threonine protein kinase
VKRIGLKLLKFHEIMTIDVRQTSPLMLPRAKNATAPSASFTQNDKSLEPPSSLSTNTSVVITEKRRSRPSRRYLLGALLGKGGNAVVYQCTCLETCEQFAIKILSKERLVQTKTLSSHVREVTIHASLQHKHICNFHHYFEDSKRCYILLELCPKGTLYHVIQARGKLDELEAACFLFDLTKAVSHLHSNRILHADVKPQNCFLTSNMNLKLGDFGLSVRLGPNQNTCTKKCGTPNYVAPEILEKREKRGYSLEVDVWSMGCVLYCMLVGVPPFQSQSVKETCVKIHSGKYSIPSFVSDDARDLITKMLHMNPKKRATLDDIQQHSFLRMVSSNIAIPVIVHATPVPCRVAPRDESSSSSTTNSSQTTVACSNTKPNKDTTIPMPLTAATFIKTKTTTTTTTASISTCMDPFQLMTRDFCHCLRQEGFAV